MLTPGQSLETTFAALAASPASSHFASPVVTGTKSGLSEHLTVRSSPPARHPASAAVQKSIRVKAFFWPLLHGLRARAGSAHL